MLTITEDHLALGKPCCSGNQTREHGEGLLMPHTEESYESYKAALLAAFFERQGIAADPEADFHEAFADAKLLHPEWFVEGEEDNSPGRDEALAIQRRKTVATKRNKNRQSWWRWPSRPAMTRTDSEILGVRNE